MRYSINKFAALLSDPRTQALLHAMPSDQLYLVGGCVRDALLGLPVKDLDFTTNLEPAQIMDRLIKAGIHTIPTGIKHQTVTAVVAHDNPNLEITTFHQAGMLTTGGVFAGKSIEEDLGARDFTINALALNVHNGELIDSTGGLEDVKHKKLSCPGSALERFKEDPLRILRLFRFEATLGFSPDNLALAAANQLAPLLQSTSIERIRDEFCKILLSPRAPEGLRRVQRIGLLKTLAPEIEAMVGFEQNRFHHLDVFEHSLAVVEKTAAEINLRLSALFHDIGKPPTLTTDDSGDRHFYLHEVVGAELTEQILRRWKFPNHTIDSVVCLVRTHMRPFTAGPGGIRRIIRDTRENFETWRLLKVADALSSTMSPQELDEQMLGFDEHLNKIKLGPDVSPLANLALKGQDLIDLGLMPGPIFGKILNALHERVLDRPELNQQNILVEMAKELISAFETSPEHSS